MPAQVAYKQELQEASGIVFNSLFGLNNMPIKRYADYLIRRGELQSYMEVCMLAVCRRSQHESWKFAYGSMDLSSNSTSCAAVGQ